MSAPETDRQDQRRRVQQYVERQRAYLPTYTGKHLFDERHGTPSKSSRSDEFGFDTPVLRPRVPVNKTSQSQLTPKAGPSKPQAHEAESRGEATRDVAPSKKDKPRPKRKKDPTPTETDNERAARLADRRERKRKKRAIVNPPQKHRDDSETVTPPNGRTKGQKTKKPTALALLYGFSATNVTKDRLTLKPPSLGVFSKGRASAKKKVTAASKFSESEFLNKTTEQAADHSKIDDDSNDSSISKDPKSQGNRTTNRTKDRNKLAETTLKTQASTRPTAASEVWDIELQSKIPSSAADVLSEPGANNSASVVLDPRGAKWSGSLEMAVEHEARCNKTRTRSLSIIQRSEVQARSDLHNELGIGHAEDVTSIHPSHSASQVGRRAADIQPSEPRQVTSKYFTEPNPVPIQEFATISTPTSRSNDGFGVHDCRIPDQDLLDTALDAQTVVSPMNSLTSVAQPMVEFQTRYDVAPLVFSSDCSPYDDCYARAHVPLEPLGVRDGGCYESSNVELCIGLSEYDAYDPQQGALHSMSTGLAGDDVDMEYIQDTYDPLTPEYEDDLEESVSAMYDPGQEWLCQDSAADEDDSICWDEESGEDVPQFFEGRALLLGGPDWRRNDGLSGLAQAEMDVAGRLRDHWRPQRLS